MNLSEFKKAYKDISTLRLATKEVIGDEEFLKTIFKEGDFEVGDYEIMTSTKTRRAAMLNLLFHQSVINYQIREWNKKVIKKGEFYLNNKYGQLMLFDRKEIK